MAGYQNRFGKSLRKGVMGIYYSVPQTGRYPRVSLKGYYVCNHEYVIANTIEWGSKSNV